MKITLIVAYFGTWPIWFPAFLLSCKYNSKIEWLFLTDCDIPEANYPNVTFVSGTLQSLNELASRKLGFEVCLARPYKICDLKSAFGLVFEDYLQDSTYWGHCDIDIVWGDIRTFITDEMLEKFDIISTRKNQVSGHFTLFRNKPKINNMCKAVNSYADILAMEQAMHFDEHIMSQVVEQANNAGLVSVYWSKFLLNFSDQRSETPSDLYDYDKGWYWQRGKLYDQTTSNNDEIMYLHFMTWKESLKDISFSYGDEPEDFYITSSSIHRRHKM